MYRLLSLILHTSVLCYRYVCSLFQREFVQQVIDGVQLMIDMERALEQGQSIDHLLPQAIQTK